MRPQVDKVFAAFAMDLLMRVVPAISPAYHQGTVGMIATMLMIGADEWDRAASRRVEENAAMRAIFRDASGAVSDQTLRGRLAKLAAGNDDDLRISALDRSNSELRAALIELHASIENQSGDRARKIAESIWRELSRSVERRRLSTAQF